MSQLDLYLDMRDAAPPPAVFGNSEDREDNATSTTETAPPTTGRGESMRVRPEDAYRWRTANSVLQAAREHLYMDGPLKRSASVIFVEDRSAPTLDGSVDEALACAMLIPSDPEELKTRWRTYSVTLNIIQTCLATACVPWPRALSDLTAVLSSRTRVDLVEDMLSGVGHPTIPDELYPFKSTVYRLALRAKLLSPLPTPAPPRHGEQTDDFVRTRLGAARFVAWHAATGLLGTGGALHPAEIETFLPQIAADAKAGDRGALTALVTYCTATMPRHFRLIGARAGGPQAAYFTDDFALLNWSSRRLHPNAPQPDLRLHCPTSDQFWAPQPVEVTQMLRSTCPREASTLHDALGAGEDLTALASAYLSKYKKVGRGLTLERLAQSLPRLVGKYARDKVLGAAAFCDFTLVNAAKLHYFVAPAARVIEACKAAYTASGFSGALAREPQCDAALNPHLRDAAIAAAIDKLNSEIFDSIRSCGSLAGWPRLHQVHSTVSCNVAAILQLTTGMRPRKKVRLNMRSFNLDLGFALVHDKACSRYEQRRLVALPAVAVAAMRTFLKWLQRLILSDKVPAYVRARLRSALKPSSTVPLFFSVGASVRPLLGKRVTAALASAGVPKCNDGRRVVERLGREGGASRAAVDAVLGHTPQGCEPFASYSALRPVDLILQVKKAMDLRLYEIGVRGRHDLPARQRRQAWRLAK